MRDIYLICIMFMMCVAVLVAVLIYLHLQMKNVRKLTVSNIDPEDVIQINKTKTHNIKTSFSEPKPSILDYEDKNKILELENKINEYLAESDNPDKKILDKLYMAIESIAYDWGISENDIDLGDRLIKSVDDLIVMFTQDATMSYTSIAKQIDVRNIDDIVKTVSTNVYEAINPRVFKTTTQYSRDFFIKYINTRTKVYVVSTCVAYNTNLSSQVFGI